MAYTMKPSKRILIVFLVFLLNNWHVSNATGTWIDLTHDLTEHMPVIPEKVVAPFSINRSVIETPVWFAVNNFKTSEHTGTHFDAPYHFNPKGWHVNEIPLNHLIAPLVVVDIADRASKIVDTPLLVEDLMAWERHHGRIPEGAVVLAHTGWDKYWNNSEKYLGNTKENPTDVHYPGLGADAVEWLLKNRNIVGVGLDALSLDVANAPTFPVHQLTAKANKYGLENLVNLGLLPASGATLYTFPLKIEGGTGSPVRVLANIPTPTEKMAKGLFGIISSFTKHF